ncbi:MAG: hypothetical protein QN173_09325 [Armatimonadota bacterium]|nr:hypothetical protein [Armatimonadota bacterium]MDR7437530.1 hypothetical protein [Armatimonadota bacterium]MDR7471701.1 hypothetical protein [Armatimonadota bacterium]MDR7507789.1 hypothetical protein [Armatimonadota bacterium]MDR7509462.1 hypothetical protein [Armatimonadota bacterium]
MGGRARLAAGVVLLALAAVPPPALAREQVQQVVVEIAFDGPAPHPLVVGRLRDTAAAVGSRLLVGRPVDSVATEHSRLAEAAGAVLGRVATGYEVAEVRVEPGPVAVLAVRLRAREPVMGPADVSAEMPGLDPRVQRLVAADLDRSRARIAELPLGLPPSALEWAAPVVVAAARDAVEEVLPGYTARVEIAAGVATRILLTVLPRDGRVIRNIGVRFRSTSIPLVLLDPHAPQVISLAGFLRGVPVEYARVRREALEEMVEAELAGYPPAARYQVAATVRMEPAETTVLTVRAESRLYRARAEAHLNIGPRAPGPLVVVRAGRLLTPQTEVFLELQVVPTPLALAAGLGVRYEVSPAVSVGVTLAPLGQATTGWAAVHLGSDVGLRGEWTLPAQVFTGAAVYRINEFLAWEAVVTTQGTAWLRLVSNF